MDQSVGRRGFLATTSMGVGSLALAGDKQAEANNTLNVGVMGMGGRGTALASAFAMLPGVRTTYVCDVDLSRANKGRDKVQQHSDQTPKAVQDFRQILDDKTVDILVVATCNHWHAPGAILGCKAGKHVYVEKPCSHNAHEGELLAQAALKHKRLVQMGNQRRSWPKIIEAMQFLKEGGIGNVLYAKSFYRNQRPSIGTAKPTDPPKNLDYALWEGPAPHQPYQSNFLHYHWHWWWNWGNGELGNNGVHSIDLCRWGLGVEFPSRVSSMGGRYRYSDQQQTPDTNIVTYDFDNGKSIMWEGLSCSREPVSNTPFCIFYGDKGGLVIEGSGYKITNAKGKVTKEVPGKGGANIHLENFVAAVREQQSLTSPMKEAHPSTLLCHLGNIAYRTQSVVNCDPKTGHILDNPDAQKLWKREYNPKWEPTV